MVRKCLVQKTTVKGGILCSDVDAMCIEGWMGKVNKEYYVEQVEIATSKLE